MARNNYPQGQLDDMEPSSVQEIVTSLKDLYDKGKPENDREIKQRIDDFFAFCQESSLRPGIESICMALHVGRTTFYNWSKGIGCSLECQEYIQSAKAVVSSFIEQAVLGGKVCAPSGIFLMKNWLGYKDTVSIEQAALEEKHEEKKLISREEMGLSIPTERPTLPGIEEND